MERNAVLFRMSPPEGKLGSARFTAGLRCFPERVLAASQARGLPKSETGLLESEGACTFSRLSRSVYGPLHVAEHQYRGQGRHIVGKRACRVRPQVDVLLDGAATKSEDCQKDAGRNAVVARTSASN